MRLHLWGWGVALSALALVSCARPSVSYRLPGPVTWSPKVESPTSLEVGDILEVCYFQSYSDSARYRLEAGDAIRILVNGAPSSSAYRLQPGDEVRLIIRSGVEQGPYRILPDGRCTLPLVGAVSMGGSTIEAATSELERLYSKHYERPSISLLVSPAAPQGAAYDATILPDGSCTVPGAGVVRLQGLTIEEATALLTNLYEERLPHAQAEVLVIRSQGKTRTFLEGMQSGLGTVRRCEIAEGGQLWLPLLRPIRALGRGLDEVRLDIEAAYREKLPDLGVTTTLASRERRTIAVMGEVVHGGVFPAPYPMSPLEAISLAGGLTDRARRSQVLLIRPESDGSVSVREINLDEALDMDDYSSLENVIRSRDLLFVPKSRIANVNMFVLQYVRGLLPVQISAGIGWDLSK